MHERFLVALRTLDAAHIETIHAFASSILRERPLEAGIDPSFQQLDQVGDELDFEERWRDWIWSVGGDELKAVERCLLLELSLEEIRKVARWLGELRDVDARMDVLQQSIEQNNQLNRRELDANAGALSTLREKIEMLTGSLTEKH